MSQSPDLFLLKKNTVDPHTPTLANCQPLSQDPLARATSSPLLDPRTVWGPSSPNPSPIGAPRLAETLRETPLYTIVLWRCPAGLFLLSRSGNRAWPGKLGLRKGDRPALTSTIRAPVSRSDRQRTFPAGAVPRVPRVPHVDSARGARPRPDSAAGAVGRRSCREMGRCALQAAVCVDE